MLSFKKIERLFAVFITFAIVSTTLPMQESIPLPELEQKINESGITLRKAKHYARCLLGNKKCSQQEIKKARMWAATVGTGILLAVGALIGIYKLDTEIKKLDELPPITKLDIKDKKNNFSRKASEELMAAAGKGDVAIMEALINKGADPNYSEGEFLRDTTSTLGIAVNSRSAGAVKILLENGADSNKSDQFTTEKDWHGDRDNAVRNLPIVSYAIFKNAPKGILNLLIDNSDVNQLDVNKAWTPLMMAAYKGNSYAVRKLLQNGADKSIKNKDGKTALDFAKEKGHTAIIKLLEN